MPDREISNPPRITIGITAYNAEETIALAVNSALGQTWSDTEIVVVDDCSTDGTADVLSELAKSVDRLRIVRHTENRGVGAARNTILEHATGAFIAFFDDDDESDPRRVETQYARIVDYERATGAGLVLCYTARRQILPDGTDRFEATLGMDATPAPSGKAVADLILLGRPTRWGRGSCATCSQMARRSVFDAVGGFDDRLRRGEDTDLNLRIALAGGHFAGISAPLVTQRIALTADKRHDLELENVLAFINRHADAFPSPAWYRFTVDWYIAKFELIAGRWVMAARGMALLGLRHPIKMSRRVVWSWPRRDYYKALAKWYPDAMRSTDSAV